MTMSPNYDVIMNFNIDEFRDRDYLMGEVNIISRRFGISRRVIMREDDTRGAEFQSAAYDLSRIDCRLIDRTYAVNLIRDEHVFLI